VLILFEWREVVDRHRTQRSSGAILKERLQGWGWASPLLGHRNVETRDFLHPGLNPRPDNSNRRLRRIPLKLTHWSAYTCQCWNQNHSHHKAHPAFLHCAYKEHDHANEDTSACDDAGKDKHQIRVRRLLEQLTDGTELTLYDVFATNIFFVETKDTRELRQEFEGNLPEYWHIHRRFLREVKPKYVVCLGYDADFSAFSLMLKLATSSSEVFESEAPNRWKDGPHIKWFRGTYCLDDGTPLCTTIVGVYHPSYRSIPPTVRNLLQKLLPQA
jgi:hypothetical protein